MRWSFRLVGILALAPQLALSQAPNRTGDSGDTSGWLSATGEARVRYESLDGQFRTGEPGSDQLLLLRSLLLIEADAGPVAVGFELQDSRTYLGDDGTPLSNSIADPLDFLQVYAHFDDLKGLLGENSVSSIKLGRQTVSIGSKRQIERVDFANVIKSYTGARFTSSAATGSELHAIYVVPTARFPNTRPALDDNKLSANKEQWGRRIWGVHYRKANAFSSIAPDVWGELFVYGLEERDTSDFQTPNRSYVAPGFRLYRKPAAGSWDIDIEGSLRRGTRHASSDPADEQNLDVNASMLFAAIGYTFNAPWKPRIAFEYYYASGDDDPGDDRFDQHERLFGSRRSDLNNTSIHGPLTPANLNAPGFRVEVKPNDRWDGRFYYHAAFLASNTDSWVIAKRRDPSGQSGDFLGHVLDGRARYWVLPEKLRFELGASALIFGDFAKAVPDGPRGSRTLFGYLQLTYSY